MCDALGTGRAVRVLSIVDNFTRECLALGTDTYLQAYGIRRRSWLDRLGFPIRFVAGLLQILI